MFSGRIADQLRARGHDAYGIVERPDLVQLPDEQVLAHGTDEGRAVLTLNIADFAALDARWASQDRVHAGLVLLSTATFRQDRSFIGAVVNALDTAAQRRRLPTAQHTGSVRSVHRDRLVHRVNDPDQPHPGIQPGQGLLMPRAIAGN